MKPRTSHRAQAGILLEALLDPCNRDGITIKEAQTLLSDAFEHPSKAAEIVGLIRNKVGDEVIVCAYDVDRKVYLYRVALGVNDAEVYVEKRKVQVRNEASNLCGMLDRCAAKYPADAEMRVVRAMLGSVVAIFDAAEENVS